MSTDAVVKLDHRSPVRVFEEIVIPITPELTWDAVERVLYLKNIDLLQKQAMNLFEQGMLRDAHQVAEWSEQRTLLRKEVQSRLSPVGRAVSELLEKQKATRTAAQRLRGVRADLRSRTGVSPTKKEVFRAFLQGLGRSRGLFVNVFMVGVGVVNGVTLVLEVQFVGQAIQEAPPEDRLRVGMREGAGLAASLYLGWLGMQAGCTYGATVGMFYFGVGSAPGCIVGGLLGGAAMGFLGRQAGRNAGDISYEGGQMVLQWLP